MAGGSAYDDWAQSHGLDSEGNGARSADADGDGHPNRLEFAFGKSPLAADSSMLQMSSSASNFTIRYLARTNGLTYAIQRSTDLRTGFAEATGITPTISSSQDDAPSGWQRMEFSVPISGGAFYRVQVTEN